LNAQDPIDVRNQASYPKAFEVKVNSQEGFSVPPRSFILAQTLERITISRTLSGFISNLSGLARIGLQVVISTYISPGYGEKEACSLTLEVFNHLDRSIKIYPGMRICHLILNRLSTPASSSYDSLVGTYSQQNLPGLSRFYKDFDSA